MISLSTVGLAEFDKQVELAFVQLEAEMSINFAAFTRKVFMSIVQTSPQWSGNLASNWNYSVKTSNESYTQSSNKQDIPRRTFQPSQAGADPAVSQAIVRMNSVAPPSWRDTVYITNATPDDQAGYLADSIIEGKVNLRPVNLVPAQGAIFEFTIGKFQEEIL